MIRIAPHARPGGHEGLRAGRPRYRSAVRPAPERGGANDRQRECELGRGARSRRALPGARRARLAAARAGPARRARALGEAGARSVAGLVRRADRARAADVQRRGAEADRRAGGTARRAHVRVAYYSPMPPERSGIADYSALLVPALRERIQVDVAQRDGNANGDVALYHVGNDADVH